VYVHRAVQHAVCSARRCNAARSAFSTATVHCSVVCMCIVQCSAVWSAQPYMQCTSTYAYNHETYVYTGVYIGVYTTELSQYIGNMLCDRCVPQSISLCVCIHQDCTTALCNRSCAASAVHLLPASGTLCMRSSGKVQYTLH
jgi:hypothetical protein